MQQHSDLTVSNVAMKYRLSKAVYETHQEGLSINEYYTRLSVLWEELENLNEYPPLSQVTPEIRAYMDAVKQQQEEQHLFQFLSG